MHVLKYGDVIGGLERKWGDVWETDLSMTDVLPRMVMKSGCQFVFAGETC
jgi:hypothetical protein